MILPFSDIVPDRRLIGYHDIPSRFNQAGIYALDFDFGFGKPFARQKTAALAVRMVFEESQMMPNTQQAPATVRPGGCRTVATHLSGNAF